jgi:RHS repeat-associated protein
MPYAPGATPVYKVNTYDAIGRTLTTVLPDGASTTSYLYQGNTVTVTDPAGKWKQYTTDVFGELTQVLEPSPNPTTEPNHVTTYSYDVLGHLIQAQMPRTINGTVVTQTRTWTYSPTTQWLSSVTQPENGTTSFTYNSDGTMATKTQAANTQTQYTYDSYGDLIQISRGTVSGGTFTEDTNQRVNYTYGGQGAQSNSAGRVQSIAYSYVSPVYQETYQYTAPGQVTNKTIYVGNPNTYATLKATYSYDNEGRMLTVTYPYDPALGGSPSYTYGFDPMGRLNTMTSGNNSVVSGVTYNAANQVLSIGGIGESRVYNVNGQMTNLRSGSYHYAYNYSATQNDGRITSMQDVTSGETITYAYDSLNRLISASGTSDPQGNWSQTFSYDGFGNLLSKLGNNAPNVTSWTVNPATNQLTSNGASYDANGNMNAYGPAGQVTNFYHDEANRLSEVMPPGNGSNNSQAQYFYDVANRRIYASISTTVNNVYSTNNYIYFYGADGKKLGIWQLTYPHGYATLTTVSTNVWFGGHLLAGEDRLQSVGKYFPYGEDRYSPAPANPPNDQEKFATYTRDSISGLDYALNRYYAAGMGRFMSADPYKSSGGASDPQSWNRYTYVGGDPINYRDSRGLEREEADDEEGGDPPSYCDSDPFAPECVPDGPATHTPSASCGPGNTANVRLTPMQQALLHGMAWSSYTQAQQLVFLTITADAWSLGVNLSGFKVSNITIASPGSGVTQTELNLTAINPSNPTAAVTNLQGSLQGFSSWASNPFVGSPHPGFTGNFRQNKFFDSMQINTNLNNGTAQIDIDPFNPAGLFGIGAIPHYVGQVLPNQISGGDTDYSKVANWLQVHRGIFVFNCPQ